MTFATPARTACAIVLLLGTTRAHAQSAPPAPRPDEQFDFMNLITASGLHDIQNESWNAYGQINLMGQAHPGFPAQYTDLNGSPNSLSNHPEWGFTGTATLYVGVRLWKGAEAYFVPEVISEQPFSNLKGLGLIQNFELQKGGSLAPQIYRSRAFLKQTIGLGGGPDVKASDPLQLGASYDRRRIVIALGNFSILDFFDKNSVLGDLRQTFFGLGFLTYAAWDFNSDARGYSYGGVVEFYWDDWAVRFGRVTPPVDPNQLPVDFKLWIHYGDALEVEHNHRLFGQPGTIRVLGFRNQDVMGRFSDAVAAFESNPAENATTCTGFNYGSANSHAPDLCWVRKLNVKLGIGMDIEQHITDDIGVFIRGMYADGQTEVDAYGPTDRSLSFGAVAHGAPWNRKADIAGIGANFGWISAEHAQYLLLGGIDGFVGDGTITPATETSLEAFYSLNFLSSIWFSGDYQLIINPAFNSARGPVNVFGVRLHAEF
jgi:hypothetical protein